MKHVFRPNPKITAEDEASLSPVLSNEHKLRKFLATNPSKQLIEKCVLIELQRARGYRSTHLTRLLNRWRDVTLKELQESIARALTNTEEG